MGEGRIADDVGWQESELGCSGLPDDRLRRRLRRLFEQFSSAPGQPVPAACGDWAATKAAYRFLDNPRVTEHSVLAGHFAAMATRCAASDGPILLLQDMIEFIYSRARPEKIGYTNPINAGHYKAGHPSVLTLCGVLMHASLAVMLAGTPLGLTVVKFWTRAKFKGKKTLERKVNSTRIPIETKESYRWLENPRQSIALLGAPERYVHVADRESDIYELFCLAQDLGTRFLVRLQTNRLAEPPQDLPQQAGAHRPFAQLDAAPWSGHHRVVIGGEVGETAQLQVKFTSIKTLPPVGKRKHYSPQILIYIHALGIGSPSGRPPIDWKLVTNLPVSDLIGAVEKLDWYALRWKAEVFHNVMKSGCRAEEARLQTADRLINFFALVAVVSWRIFFITMSARAEPDAPPGSVLTQSEISALNRIDAASSKPRLAKRRLADYLLRIDMLGGHLARSRDPPIGNTVVWRGLARLHDLAFEIAIAAVPRCG